MGFLTLIPSILIISGGIGLVVAHVAKDGWVFAIPGIVIVVGGAIVCVARIKRLMKKAEP